MGYLKEFHKQIQKRDFQKFFHLWEEYITCDIVEVDELSQLLQMVKTSDFAKQFGKIVESALPLWEKIEDPKDSSRILSLIIDLQTTQSPLLADLAYQELHKKYANDPKFQERLRLVGMRTRENFQGALANYALLVHMEPGNFVYHTGGWGTGEILSVSHLREHLVIDFENVSGKKDLSFINAFKTLIPLSKESFLARRFANPDKLEEEAKKDPVEIIRLLLNDLGPQTAIEIKDHLCELVIPEEDWTRWWQSARAKMKKDPFIETPDNLRDPFKLRKSQISHEEQLKKAMHGKTEYNDLILSTYNFVRDHSKALRNEEMKQELQNKLFHLLEEKDLTKSQALQIHIFLETFFNVPDEVKQVKEFIQNLTQVEAVINDIDILAFKKRAIVAIKEYREDWIPLFEKLLISVPQSALRDYILKELNSDEARPYLEKTLRTLLENPTSHPDIFVWVFQKILTKTKDHLPYHNQEGEIVFFESFLILLSYIESKPQFRDLVKKMYLLITGKRFALVRHIFQHANIETIKEFLLLASKCHTFTDHDIKILRSLAEVAQPSLAPSKRSKERTSEDIIWTTEAGLQKTQEELKRIGTIEIVENAKEIEAARALGDLRENSEFKFALERRDRLQETLKRLSDQVKQARIITPSDINTEEVDVGTVVTLKDSLEQLKTLTILGPWEADSDQNIISFQSPFAQALQGRKQGETFKFRDDTYEVIEIKSYLE